MKKQWFLGFVVTLVILCFVGFYKFQNDRYVLIMECILDGRCNIRENNIQYSPDNVEQMATMAQRGNIDANIKIYDYLMKNISKPTIYDGYLFGILSDFQNDYYVTAYIYTLSENGRCEEASLYLNALIDKEKRRSLIRGGVRKYYLDNYYEYQKRIKENHC